MKMLRRKEVPAAAEQAPQPAAVESAPQPPAAVASAPDSPPPADRAAKYTAQLADARVLREQMLRELSRGADRDDQLMTLDAEIADLERRLAWIAEARKLEAKQNSKEGKAARFEQTKATLQSALDQARTLGARAEKIIAAIAALGSELKEIEQAKAGINYHFAAAITDAVNAKPSPRTERRLAADYENLRATLHAITLPDHLCRAIVTSGIGRVGVALPPDLFNVPVLTGTLENIGKAPTAEVIEDAVKRLKALGNAQLMTLREVAA